MKSSHLLDTAYKVYLTAANSNNFLGMLISWSVILELEKNL